MRRHFYNPWILYHADEEIRRAVQLIERDFFSMMKPGIFRPVTQSLLEGGDYYMLLADFRDYIETQERVDRLTKIPAGGTGRLSSTWRGLEVLVRPHDTRVRLSDLARSALCGCPAADCVTCQHKRKAPRPFRDIFAA